MLSKQGYSQLDKTTKIIRYTNSDTIRVDSASFYHYGFKLKVNGSIVAPSKYTLNPTKGYLVIKNLKINKKDSISTSYYKLPFNYSQTFYHKSDTLIFSDIDSTLKPSLYSINNNDEKFDFFSESQLNKQGSISRGVSVGNAQNLSFQSTLNLQLNGKIGPDLFIKGSISDDNIPFQPDGNTQKLQEFDQVFLQIYNDDFSVIGGDFWLKKPQGYFLNYQKRSQGLSVEYKHGIAKAKINPTISHKLSGAFSRGKFSRNIIQGIEGSQGPYRLFGENNEQNIIILAGTESVYIDGTLMKRGQNFDYIIDYNGSEITFTANQFITKDKRIIIEFQYSDLNYARSLMAYNTEIVTEKFQIWGNFYSEQDAKNQPIQQDLSLQQKQILSNAGDNIGEALVSSIYPFEYSENNLQYYLTEDSILIFSNNKDSAKYRANFALVGQKKGNYIIDKYTANGKIYKWIQPVNTIPQGNYEPIQILIPPKQNQMITIGGNYQINTNTSSKVELAYTKNDLNSFSAIDKFNDAGYGLKWEFQNKKALKQKNKTLTSRIHFEFNDKNFTPIQWFRSAEFDRDWNVRQKNYSGNQYLSSASFNYNHTNSTQFLYKINQLTWGTDYSGWKNDLNLNINRKTFQLKFNGNYLFSNGEENSTYIRHKSLLLKKFKGFKIGLNDILERNEITQQSGLLNSSFQFYDIKSFISIGDSTKNYHEVYYQQRHDWLSDSTDLKHIAKANIYGLSSQFNKNKAHKLKLNLNYRQLDIIDSTLIKQNPEQSILGRIEQNLFIWKGALTSRIFYELNSGLELKKDFVYIQVNNGQGIYTWIDYNNDNIKDIGEFEIAQFTDQGEYIRVNIATTEYIRTFGNQFSQTLFIKPERMWRNKKGIKKIIALFSNQTTYNINRKTNYENGLSALNPFDYSIADTSLINSISTFRNTLFFNRLNPVFGLEYNFQINNSKNLLTSGFDGNSRQQNILKLRWNISKFYNLKLEYANGNRASNSDYSPTRNFDYKTQTSKLNFTYQPTTTVRLASFFEYALKENASDLNEKAKIIKIGGEFRLNQKKKGSLSGNITTSIIDYTSETNTPLAFELLESLKPGLNFIWGISYQRKIANNLQLNFNYNGRKSESVKSIHSGGMELRAFF